MVCGSREKNLRYRLPKLPERNEWSPLRADTQLATGLRGSVHVDPIELPGGAKSNRLMITVATHF